MRRPKIVVFVSVILVLSGCTETLKKIEPYMGPVVGGAALGGLCYAYFSGKGKRALATSLCATGGALLGKIIQDKLKESEKPVLTEATYNTLQTGQKQTVMTAEGTTIITERVAPVVAAPPVQNSQPTASSRSAIQAKPAAQPERIRRPTPPPASVSAPTSAPTPSPPAIKVADGNCGSVKQTIVLKNKERYEDTVTACQKDGVWVT